MELTDAQKAHLAAVKQQVQENFDSHKAHFEYVFPGLTLASTIGIRVEAVAPKSEEEVPQKDES